MSPRSSSQSSKANPVLSQRNKPLYQQNQNTLSSSVDAVDNQQLAQLPYMSREARQSTVLRLQSTRGNTAVRRMMAQGLLSSLAVQRDETDGGDGAPTDSQAPAPSEAPPTDGTDPMAETAKELSQDNETLTGEKIEITEDLLSLVSPGKMSEPDLGDTKKDKDKNKFTYQEYKAGLYGGSGTAKASDVTQGQLGDCYLLSAMKAIARVNPDVLKSLISPKDDGTYDVTLYVYAHFWSRKRSPKVVNVKPTFPTTKGGKLAYTSGPVLWPMLIEKAYAQEKGGYDDIEGGFGNEAMELLTNAKSEKIDPGDFSDDKLVVKVKELINNKNAVTAGSKKLFWKSDKKKADDLDIVTGHEYSVKDADVGAQTIDLDNPWGYKHLNNLSISDFKKFYDELSWNPTK